MALEEPVEEAHGKEEKEVSGERDAELEVRGERVPVWQGLTVGEAGRECEAL